jgi:hypothetical protein
MMQLDTLVLYGPEGEVRTIDFKPGQLNIITGESGTGKSSLIGILRFLLGGDSPHVPLGPIQNTVRWYGLLAHAGETQCFIARPAPAHGATTTQAVLAIGETSVPPMASLNINSNADDLVAYLGGLVGIEENLFEPPEGQTRRALAANFRHSLYYCFQGQGEVANPDILFHRQNREFQKQAIRDTLPYFLGAQGMDAIRKRQDLATLRRTIRQKTNELQRARDQQDRGLGLALGLLAEAQSSGLLDNQQVPTNADEAKAILVRVLQDEEPAADVAESDDRQQAELLVQQRSSLRQRIRDINGTLRGLDDFANVSTEYGQELNEHRVRLASIGLVPEGANGDVVCPLCTSTVAGQPVHEAITQRLGRVTKRLELAQRDQPRVEAARAQLLQEREAARTALADVDSALESLAHTDEARAAARGRVAQHSFVRGRIAQYLATLPTDVVNVVKMLAQQLDDLNARADALAEELDPETLRSAVESQLAIASRKMTKLARALPLEHSDHGVRIDPHRLTVVADTLQGPAYMDAGAIGSGMSWVGYHLTAYLGLQDFFIAAGRPVPRFLVLDQPSQAFFPRDREEGGDLSELSDSDRDNTRKLYKMLYDVVGSLGGKLQIIAFDHADFRDDDWFQESVIETWRDGTALIPRGWIEQVAGGD